MSSTGGSGREPQVSIEDGAESWTEWGVRRTWGAVGTIARLDRRSAEVCAKEWPGELVSRTVTASEWTSVIAPPASGGRMLSNEAFRD